MISAILYSFLIAATITMTVESAAPYPSGPCAVWEFVNCVDESNGSQTSEAWEWASGEIGPTGTPLWKYVVAHGSYYWEGQTTSFYNNQGALHKAFIFNSASTNQDGPMGIEITQEATGSWAWYGSGWAPRAVGSGYTCNAVYWSMKLPHVVAQATFSSDQQGICKYSASFQDVANAVGLTYNLQSGSSSFANTNLYAMASCCYTSADNCCGCYPCGGEIANSVNVGTSGANGEVQLMIDHMIGVGSKLTTVTSCNCDNNENGDCNPNPDGTVTPANGRVDLVYGPFTDYTGKYPQNPSGVAPYIQYSLYEQPPQQCPGSIVDTFVGILQDGLVSLLTGGIGDAETIIELAANAGSSISVYGLECALG